MGRMKSTLTKVKGRPKKVNKKHKWNEKKKKITRRRNMTIQLTEEIEEEKRKPNPDKHTLYKLKLRLSRYNHQLLSASTVWEDVAKETWENANTVLSLMSNKVVKHIDGKVYDYIILSEKQADTLESFFKWEYTEILYWGWARWWKSYLIWVILGLCVASMPWSKWLLSRTVLAELQATTLSTFKKVLKSLWFWDKSYADKIREKKRMEFKNDSEVYVIQVNYEPSDPEFDRLGSYSYTWAFLDEWQQMATKVRSVLDGRFSETSWSFEFKVKKVHWKTPDWNNIWYSKTIKVVKEAVYSLDEIRTPNADIKEIIQYGKYYCVITEYKQFNVPYTINNVKEVWDYYVAQAVWRFTPITLISCNPWKNFTYSDFYKPYSKWIAEWDEFKYLTTELDDWTIFKKKFIRALVTDNPFVENQYIKRLEASNDETTKQRLLYWNFEYDDDPKLLFDTKHLVEMFNKTFETLDNTYYLTIDAARQGKDKTVIMLWQWMNVKTIYTIDKASLTDQAETIKNMFIYKYNINLNNVLVDEVWVWWWLVDILWCRWFIANASPINPYASKYRADMKRNYANLRTQAFYYLKHYIETYKIHINCSETFKEILLEELWFIKTDSIDSDTKIRLESKGKMKLMLWRSPDYADALSFRMYWIIKNHHEWNTDNADKEEVDPILESLEEQEEEELDEVYNVSEEVDLSVY